MDESTSIDSSQELISDIIDVIRKHEPTCDEVHCTLSYILADVMTQMEPTKEGFEEVMQFTTTTIQSAADCQNGSGSATIN